MTRYIKGMTDAVVRDMVASAFGGERRGKRSADILHAVALVAHEVERFRGPRADPDGLRAMQRMDANMTPLKRALADAEWQAMDNRGQLPADWPERRAEIAVQFGEQQP